MTITGDNHIVYYNRVNAQQTITEEINKISNVCSENYVN